MLEPFTEGGMIMPTPTAQITGSYTSGLHYVDYGCTDLAIELGALARRENQLAIAQEQKIKQVSLRRSGKNLVKVTVLKRLNQDVLTLM